MEHLKRISIGLCLAVISICVFLPGRIWAADDVPAARNGIIEVQSGFIDEKGMFREMKSGSGFLISNRDSAVYIVTNSSNVSNTPREIKKYCRKKGISNGDSQFTNSIRIIVKGDVAAQAEVVVKSAEQDYCILSTENVVSMKEALKLSDSTEVKINDIVYALGFPSKAETEADAMEYSETDVKIIRGAVTGQGEMIGSNAYIAHSAPVGQGNAGGPLLDADGYVIGLCCKESPENDTGVTYALPVNEIAAVLDNFSIYYGSREIDNSYAQLEKEYQECIGIPADQYKSASAETLKEALSLAEAALELEEPQAEDLQEGYRILTEAREKLVPKTEKITIAVRVMAVINGCLFFWFLILVIKNAKEKKMMDVSSFKQAGHAGAVPLQRPVQSVQSRMEEQTGYIAGQPLMARDSLQMICKKTAQAITISGEQFIIGKSREAADFCIADNQAVSRRHAAFSRKDGNWYINDMGSLNGTYVNGIRVEPGQPAAVKVGDEIVLADEIFIVQG